MQIRMAQAGDSEAVVRVIKAVYDEYEFPWFPEGYHADLYDLQSHYLDHGYPFWVAAVDGVIQGTAALHRFERFPGEVGEITMVDGHERAASTDCSLERMYVHPEGRRMGIGGRLLETATAWAKANGCRAMELWSDKRFEDAHRLYQRYGARMIGERLCHDPDQSPEWGLVLEL